VRVCATGPTRCSYSAVAADNGNLPSRRRAAEVKVTVYRGWGGHGAASGRETKGLQGPPRPVWPARCAASRPYVPSVRPGAALCSIGPAGPVPSGLGQGGLSANAFGRSPLVPWMATGAAVRASDHRLIVASMVSRRGRRSDWACGTGMDPSRCGASSHRDHPGASRPPRPDPAGCLALAMATRPRAKSTMPRGAGQPARREARLPSGILFRAARQRGVRHQDGGHAPPRADPRRSHVHHGFDGQLPRGSDIFGLDVWHWGTPNQPRNPNPPR